MHVPADQAGVGLAHLRDGLAGGVMENLDLVDRFVGFAVTEDGNVEHGSFCLGVPESGTTTSVPREGWEPKACQWNFELRKWRQVHDVIVLSTARAHIFLASKHVCDDAPRHGIDDLVIGDARLTVLLESVDAIDGATARAFNFNAQIGKPFQGFGAD